MDCRGEKFLKINLKALDLDSPVRVFGNTQKTEDGFTFRDFIYLRDAARAMVKKLDFGSSERFQNALILNICLQNETSLRRVLNLLES